MLVVGETLSIFLFTGILNIDICLIKNMNDVVVISNIYNYFASKILTYKKNETN